MANAIEKLEKFYKEQMIVHKDFRVGDIVALSEYAGEMRRANRAFPGIILSTQGSDGPGDLQSIVYGYFDEDDDFMVRYAAPHELILLKRMNNE